MQINLKRVLWTRNIIVEIINIKMVIKVMRMENLTSEVYSKRRSQTKDHQQL